MRFWRRLRGQPSVAPATAPEAPLQREHLPDLHALKQQQTVYSGRADLLRQHLAAERWADEQTYGGRDAGSG